MKTTTGPRATRRSSARPRGAVGPVMDRHAGHRRVDRVVVEAAAIRRWRRGTARRRPAAAPASSRSARPPAPSGRAARRTPSRHRRSAPSAHRPAPRGSAPRSAGRPAAAARSPCRASRSRPASPPTTVPRSQTRAIRGNCELTGEGPRCARALFDLARRDVGRAEPAVGHEAGRGDEARLVARQEERRGAISSGSPKRPIGTWTSRFAARSGSLAKSSFRSGVLTGPGQSALTRTPRAANSTPSSRESASTAPFEAV